jgi:tetratricopeptide (TPR) repeat protein
VEFLVVYQREPHAGQVAFKNIRQPETYHERSALAKRTKEELELELPFLIDTMEDLSRAYFGDLAGPAIIIGPDGIICAKLPWAEPQKIGPVLAEVLRDAASLLQAAVARAKEPRAEADARISLGLYHMRKGAPREAKAAFEKAFELIKEENSITYAKAARGYAETLAALGIKEENEAWLDRARDAASGAFKEDPGRLTAALTELALLRGDSAKAIPLFEQVVRLAEKSGPGRQLAWGLNRLADAYEAAGRTEDARRTRARAAKTTEPEY